MRYTTALDEQLIEHGNSQPIQTRFRYGEARALWLGASRLEHRVCTLCRIEQPIEEFHRVTEDRRMTVCRTCRLMKQRSYRAARPADRVIRDRLGMTGWRFGLTPEAVAAILARQNNRCAICGRQMTRGRGLDAANLDHKRGTGQPRGFLCKECNIKVGHFEHVQRFSAEFMSRMTIYLAAYDRGASEVGQLST